METKVIRVLLVEDNPGDARLIQEMLKEAGEGIFAIEWVHRLKDGLERLDRGGLNVVLLDLGLPDSQGLDTFARSYAHAPQIPLVLLTGLADETLAITAVRQGAQDYLVKGQVDGGLLVRALRYATERKRMEQALQQSHDTLEQRVEERTAELQEANAQLLQEIAERKRAETSLRRAQEELETRVAERTAALAQANTLLQREVEERRVAERAVEVERQRLFSLLDGLPSFVYLKGQDYSIRFANRAFREIFGDTQGKRCFEVVYGRTEPCSDCPSFQVLASKQPQVWEWTRVSAGRAYQVYNYPFVDIDGSPLVLTLGMDITQRKQAEEALEVERQRLYDLLDGLPAMVYLKSPDYHIRFANRYFREIFGKWEGKRCFEALRDGKEPCEFCPCVSVFETGNPNELELTNPDINRSFQVSNYPLADIDGSPQVLTLAIDITQRKQVEEALKESEKNLRYLASQLLSAQETERKRLSRELHDELGQSLLVLKLQIRSLAKRLGGEAQAAGPDCVAILSYLDEVIDNVRRLSRDLSPYILEDLGLFSALHYLVRQFDKHHDIQFLLDLEEIDGLFFPEAQVNIYRIFQEALTNIGKYAQATQVFITGKRQEDRVFFVVEDNGRGFNLNQVMADPGGKGLGLAAMEERVRMLGGVLEIRSREGAGTRIAFTLPIEVGGEIQ